MAADLHIHVIDNGVTQDDVKAFLGNTFGSKWSAGFGFGNRPADIYERIAKAPDVWVGEVSWLKAALLEDGDDFIPSHVQSVADAIGEDFPVIDDDLIGAIDAAFAQPNTSIYHDEGIEQTHAAVLEFLRSHVGKQCFTVSW